MLIKIHRNQDLVEFSGNGTYQFREEIKSLGSVQWDQTKKRWLLRGTIPSLEILNSLFPGSSVEDIADDSKDSGSRSSVPDHPKFSVIQLHKQIERTLRQAFAQTVLVFGVVQKVTRGNARQAVYIDLGDLDDPTRYISCRMFGNVEALCRPLREAGFALERDLQVMFLVSVQYNPLRGSVQLQIERIIAEYTIAKVAALREQTVRRLKQEGLFEQNKAQKFPFLPIRLGVITSDRGTVIHDFLSALSESRFAFEIEWKKVSVQGAAAKKELIRAVESFSKAYSVDVVLMFRGGGSPAELAVFNDYDLARAICLCPIPVMSAIGHEEDMCAVQDVSFKTCGVPKSLGHFLSQIIIQRRQAFAEYIRIILGLLERTTTHALVDFRRHQENITRSSRFTLEKAEQKLTDALRAIPSYSRREIHIRQEYLSSFLKELPQQSLRLLEDREKDVVVARQESLFRSRLIFESVLQRVRQAQEKVLMYCQRLVSSSEQLGSSVTRSVQNYQTLLVARTNDLENLWRAVDAHSLERQLQRGFSLVRQQDGEIVKSVTQTSPGQIVSMEFRDGKRRAVVAQNQEE